MLTMKNMKYMKGIATIAICLFCSLRVLGAEGEWKVTQGKHFIVNYVGDEAAAKAALTRAEECYRRILDDIGYRKPDEFWLWEKRAKILLFESNEAFARATAAPQWASGRANYSRREIAGIRADAEFLDQILPHELGHLIFREFIGFQNDAPLWLDEGVAIRAERSSGGAGAGDGAIPMVPDRFIRLSKLAEMDVRSSKDRELVVQFYAESASIVGYLVEQKGAERFAAFCRVLRDGKNLNDALKAAYGESMQSVDELEKEWLKHLLSSRGNAEGKDKPKQQ